ncbi:hypothetical protein [Gordonia rubripertincta]|uniref:hypothetical protein n=1 Tax=Gordonia rubripertincta TaxID=36822 RepID=UPI0015FA059D|nr:hypothetical protein [Gordonia rubripertincta]QMU22037.1 hypothetical protein H3V45_05980 [Gordonia rubripertincta]
MTLYRMPNGGAYLAFTRCADCGKAIGLIPGHDGSSHPDSGAGWAHVQRPDHPHLADLPEFVGSRYEQPTETAETLALRKLGDVIASTLRQVLTVTGHSDAPPETVAARHHLDAMAEAWDQGYDDGREDGRYDERYVEGVNPNAVPENPYRKLIDDRREFVREQVENGYGAVVYPPTSDTAYDDCENVLGDDNAEWFDAVLDAHDEWRAMQAGETR